MNLTVRKPASHRTIGSNRGRSSAKITSKHCWPSIGENMKKKRTAKANPKQVQDTDVAIGERIRARRNQIEMSQEELGDALKVSFQQIQKYEKGNNRISSGRVLQLAQAL